MLLNEKYVPNKLEDIEFGKYNYLQDIENIPNTIIYGSSGCGKYTLLNTWLQSIYGNGVTKMNKIIKECKLVNNSKVIELSIFYSKYHYIINPSLYGLYDKQVLLTFLKELSDTTDITNVFQKKKYSKIVVIQNADYLSKNAQNALRSEIENNNNSIRIIFMVNNLNKLIEPILSRCLLVKISRPSNNYLESILNNVMEKEGINNIKISKEIYPKLFEYFSYNIRKLINFIEYLNIYNNTNNIEVIEDIKNEKVKKSKKTKKNKSQEIIENYKNSNVIEEKKINYNIINIDDIDFIDNLENNLNIDNHNNYNEYINRMYEYILDAKLEDILVIRDLFYSLMISFNKPNTIFKSIYNKLEKYIISVDNLNDNEKNLLLSQINEILIDVNTYSSNGNKPIIYFENFILNIFYLFRHYKISRV